MDGGDPEDVGRAASRLARRWGGERKEGGAAEATLRPTVARRSPAKMIALARISCSSDSNFS
jgi:hypothetical protein